MSDTCRLWTYIEKIRDCKTEAELDWIARECVKFKATSRITAEQYKRLIKLGKDKRKELAASPGGE